MKYALILIDGLVGPTAEGPEGFNIHSAYTAPIPDGSQWMECPNDIEPGDTYINGEFVKAPRPIQPITKLQFLRRFTAEERIAIRTSADPVIIDFMALLDLAEDVRVDDPDTIGAVTYLTNQGLLATGRDEEILSQ